MEFFKKFWSGKREAKPAYTAQGQYGLWQITSDNRLTLFGNAGRPTREWTRRDFEPMLMKFLAQTTHYDRDGEFRELMPLEALSVEYYVALGFYYAGELTTDHLRGARENPNPAEQMIEVPRFLLDGELALRIRPQMYYDIYSLDVRDHPKGYANVRPTPDVLALLSDEETI